MQRSSQAWNSLLPGILFVTAPAGTWFVLRR